MPQAAIDNNRAGANHPFPDHPETPGGEGDDNETGEEGGEPAGEQPDDVPPAHAQDGAPEDGQPDDVPPAHSSGTPHEEHPAA